MGRTPAENAEGGEGQVRVRVGVRVGVGALVRGRRCLLIRDI
ncbi:MAG: hypothetical protein ACOX52_11795 [Verrucomicrobiota bacterium]